MRQGRVAQHRRDEIVARGRVDPDGPRQVHVDCTAAGLRVGPGRPIFEGDRITLQQVRTASRRSTPRWSRYIEAATATMPSKNRLCPPNPYPDRGRRLDHGERDLGQRAQADVVGEPDLMAWMDTVAAERRTRHRRSHG